MRRSTVTMIPIAAFVCMAGIGLYRLTHVPRSLDLRPSPPDDHMTMNAITYSSHGDTSVLKFDHRHPRPRIKENQVLIKVMASSLNPCDFKFRRNPVPGFLLPLPKIPGEDVAGVVVELGSKTSEFHVRDRVAAMLPILGARWGSAADFVAVDESLVAHLSDAMSFEDAAAVPLVSLTVLQAFSKLTQWRKVENRKVLIHAGAGGVGTFAIQYAKNVLGAFVATTASQEKHELLKSIGADLVIDYRTQDFENVAQNFDAVLDTMSWSYESRTLGKNSNVLKPTGHYLNICGSDWAFKGREITNGYLTAKNLLIHKILNLVRPGSLPMYDIVFVEPNGPQLQSVMDLVGNDTIHAIIDKRFRFAEAAAAYDYLEEGHSTGKVVLEHLN